jgi:hypothetical protein
MKGAFAQKGAAAGIIFDIVRTKKDDWPILGQEKVSHFFYFYDFLYKKILISG